MKQISVGADDEDATFHEQRFCELVALIEEGTARLRQRDDLEERLMVVQIVIQRARVPLIVVEHEHLEPSVGDF